MSTSNITIINWKSDSFSESNQEGKKQRFIPKMKQRRLRVITLQEAIMKINNFIALTLFRILGAPIIFSPILKSYKC